MNLRKLYIQLQAMIVMHWAGDVNVKWGLIIVTLYASIYAWRIINLETLVIK